MLIDKNWRGEIEEIANFIENKLPRRLEDDQLECKILTETDLHACVFSHIEKCISSINSENWFILNEPYLKLKKSEQKKPDIVICMKKDKKMHPKILIELKENRSFSFSKQKTPLDGDTRKLIKMIKRNKDKLNLQRTRISNNYLILAITSENPDIIRKNDPCKIKDKLQQKVDNELQNKNINKKWIRVIVISAFYSKDFETRRQALEKIRTLREITLR